MRNHSSDMVHMTVPSFLLYISKRQTFNMLFDENCSNFICAFQTF